MILRPSPSNVTLSRLEAFNVALSQGRQELFRDNGRRVSRSALIASGVAVALYLVMMVVGPIERRLVPTVDLPEHSRVVVLEPAVPEPPAPRPPDALEQMNVQQTPDPPAAALVEPDQPHTVQNVRARPLDPDAGVAGRARAEQATAALEQANRALDRSLDGLAAALGTTGATGEPVRRRRAYGVRGGRGDGELASVGNESALRGAPELRGSAVQASVLAIGPAAAAGSSGGAAAERPSGDGAAPGVYRSNASLLAVIQRYSAGIQYCYTNELKRDGSLKGKLVVTLTVAASGEVTAVTMVQNTVASERLAGCALAQIREWRFPAIREGVTSFQVPFVFTPPN